MAIPEISILMVDDHQDGADSLAEVLRICGYESHVVYESSTALSAAAKKLPDVFISDIGLPHIDGCRLAQQLQAIGGPKPLMIAVTGFGNMRGKCLEAGSDHIFIKPADPNGTPQT